jgi:3,4-dihydroxy 2-butanone 4-phosphate synthase / GTP cyclohydrolase II
VLVLLNCSESPEHLFKQFTALAEVDRQGFASQSTLQYRMDLRTYGVGAQILKHVGVGRMKLLAKPRKMPSMAGFELHVTGYAGEEGHS